MTLQIPTFQDVLAAKRRLRPYLQRTPMNSYPAINELIGTEVFIKHENCQPICAFKVRGGINLVSQMSDEERRRGVIAASTGNHGQSVAYAAQLFGVAAKIVVPENANPGKVASMCGRGAEVIFHGAKFDDARLHCEELAEKHGYCYVHSGDEPLLIAGVATEALEKQNFVMWQVEDGHEPTLEEAKARLDHLNEFGDSDHAFGWSYVPQAKLWLEARCA